MRNPAATGKCGKMPSDLRCPSILRARVRVDKEIPSGAQGAFSKKLLYHSRNIPVQNPFTGLEMTSPKAEAYSPLPPRNTRHDPERLLARTLSSRQHVCVTCVGGRFRRSEIEACRVSWFSVQKDRVMEEVRERLLRPADSHQITKS